ncbi:hypothetical protein CCY99_08430 [Helicobacter sp. 16-1353]|uniref:methyltransferase domain-containing protein n=1 Tax=Helicobacter sp. 16-1353 TaxID=2004996 RepID=UPI000DCE17EA|nr:methyltransferase domain-containing protein [Helicobacter sp. 16-1353]RAX51817.1 hypothetical protein CCY99_08430 [Helicobacter sp. 16-1353]
MTKFSFSKEAKNYLVYSQLQNKIAKDLLSKSMNKDIKRILDLGAGSGNIARNLTYNIDYFLGIDSAESMLLLHPTNLSNIKLLELRKMDFEDYEFSEKFDLIIASSSLHWAKNLESIFQKIADSAFQNKGDSKAESILKNVESKADSTLDSTLDSTPNDHKNPANPKLAFSFFTAKSLETLHNFLGTKSPLRSSFEIEILLKKYFIGEIEIQKITKTFDNKNDLLAHLKNSGLLGGGNLPFRAKKKLKFDIPFLELSYEVLFFIGEAKQKN